MRGNARMAKLVDALASGASVRKNVEVQVLFRAPHYETRAFTALFDTLCQNESYKLN